MVLETMDRIIVKEISEHSYKLRDRRAAVQTSFVPLPGEYKPRKWRQKLVKVKNGLSIESWCPEGDRNLPEGLRESVLKGKRKQMSSSRDNLTRKSARLQDLPAAIDSSALDTLYYERFKSTENADANDKISDSQSNTAPTGSTADGIASSEEQNTSNQIQNQISGNTGS